MFCKAALRRILEGPFIADQSMKDHELIRLDKEAFANTQRLHKSCMNESLVDLLGAEPLIKIVSDFRTKHFPLKVSATSANSTDPTSLAEALAAAQLVGSSGLFDLGIEADVRDPNSNVIILSQGGLSLGSEKSYEDSKLAALLEEQIASFFNVSRVYSNGGENGVSAGMAVQMEAAREVVNLEKRLAGLFLPR